MTSQQHFQHFCKHFKSVQSARIWSPSLQYGMWHHSPLITGSRIQSTKKHRKTGLMQYNNPTPCTVWLLTITDRTRPVPDHSHHLSSCFWCAKYLARMWQYLLWTWCLGFYWIRRKHWIRPCRLWSQFITSIDWSSFLWSTAGKNSFAKTP